MRILFLDDSIERINKFRNNINECVRVDFIVTCKTAKECIQYLKDYDWDFVFLDHDLGDEVFVSSDREDCGMEVVRFLSKNKKDIHCIFCHSLNESARIKMVDDLVESKYNAIGIPFIMIDWDNLYTNLYTILTRKITIS